MPTSLFLIWAYDLSNTLDNSRKIISEGFTRWKTNIVGDEQNWSQFVVKTGQINASFVYQRNLILNYINWLMVNAVFTMVCFWLKSQHRSTTAWGTTAEFWSAWPEITVQEVKSVPTLKPIECCGEYPKLTFRLPNFPYSTNIRSFGLRLLKLTTFMITFKG